MDLEGLKSLSLSQDPMESFEAWFKMASDAGQIEPTAMTLSTVDRKGLPDSRIVLIKSHRKGGFRFFTNYESEKGKQLLASPYASLVFHWNMPEHRQIRIRGPVEKLSHEESNDYFQLRPRGSRISAVASPQSQPIDSREYLDRLHKEAEAKFEGQEIPCPENWGGFILKPEVMEFWQEREFRYHDRFCYSKSSADAQSWDIVRLSP